MLALSQRSYFSQHTVLSTRDLDEARFRISEKFCDHSLEVIDNRAQLSVLHNTVRGRNISVNFLSYGAEVAVNPGMLGEFYLFHINLSGRANIQHRGEEMTADVQAGTMLNPDRPARLRWAADCSKLLFQIDRTHLETVAQTLIGAPLPGPIRFDMRVDFKTPEGQQLQRAFVASAAAVERRSLFHRPGSLSDLHIEYDLAHALLTLQNSNISHIIAGADHGSKPGEIRRAIGYIHANISEPITIVDIAAAAGINVRTLQKTCRRTFDKTPMEMLRDARLDAARYLLLARCETLSVSEAAYSCGFSHLGRFSHYYRERFGQSPSNRG